MLKYELFNTSAAVDILVYLYKTSYINIRFQDTEMSVCSVCFKLTST